MNKKIEKLKYFRLYLLKQIEGLTAQQLNTVPAGFNNNIIWNLGHMISAQQNMCYLRANLPFVVDEKQLSPFISGKKPEAIIEGQAINTLKDLFIDSIDKLQSDIDNNLFGNYTPSMAILKAYGFEVNNIEGALEYLLHHDGQHMGIILSLKHLV